MLLLKSQPSSLPTPTSGNTTSSPLPVGRRSKFRIHANKLKCNAVAPHGILFVATRGKTNCDIITEYQYIFSTNITDAFSACTDDPIIHNSKAFYAMLSKSVTGNICNTVFKQSQNLPSDKDGITLLKLFT